MKTLDRVLIIVGLYIGSFIIATITIYTIKDWQFDTLITSVLGAGAAEVILTAIITITKIRKGKVDNEDDPML